MLNSLSSMVSELTSFINELIAIAIEFGKIALIVYIISAVMKVLRRF